MREYVVLTVADGSLHGFSFPEGTPLPLEEGVLRSAAFPGLWIDGEALKRGDGAGLLATLDAGLGRAEHAAFVTRLAAQRKA